MAGRSGGSQVAALMVLLGLLAGAGTWNYRRNAAADAEEYRPYRGYSATDLAALEAAYGQEIAVESRRYAKAKGRAVEVSGGGLLGDQIREFERVQQLSRSEREAGGEVAQREAAVAHIHEELRRRAVEADRLKFHLTRLLTYRAR